MRYILALSVLTVTSFSEPESAWARTTTKSRWHSFCEKALGTPERIEAGWRALREHSVRFYDDLYDSAEVVVELVHEWLGRFDDAMHDSRRHAEEFHRLRWGHPAKIVHFVNRSSAMLTSLAAMFESEDGRANFNEQFLDWELGAHRGWRGPATPFGPKYFVDTLDVASVDRILENTFPDFHEDSDLRVLEVAVSPVVLFVAGKRIPRVHRRPTVLVLRKNLVLKAFPMIEGRPRELFTNP